MFLMIVNISGYISNCINYYYEAMKFFYILMSFIIVTLFILGILEIKYCRCTCKN